MKKVIKSIKLVFFPSFFFSFSVSNKVLISKSPVAPFASFVYTIHAQGIVLERQDLPGQGECMRKISIILKYFMLCVCEIIEGKISGLFTCSVFFSSNRENIGKRYLLVALKHLYTQVEGHLKSI